MKKIQNIIAAVCLLFLFAACHRGNSIMISSGDDNLSINYSGEIKFNDDETAIKSISHNGYLRYIRNDRKLLAENDSQGEIKYELYDNGKKINLNDQEGKLFLADAIKDMIGVGFDAKGRLDRLYKKGGSQAVLNEVENLKMDYVKSMYLEYLFSVDSIRQNEMTEIAKKIGSKLGSDYDKGRLLTKFPAEYLKDSSTAYAWFQSVKSIGADYEKSNALIYITRQALTKEQFIQAIDISNSIGSDYEKAKVLKELIFKTSFPEEGFDRTLDAVSYIGSDYEKANLLKALIEKEKPSEKQFDKLLDLTEHIGSDYDKTNLIRELIAIGIPTGASFDKLLSAVVHTGSEFDRANLIKEITRKNITSDDQWISIINATSEISSDVDKSNLLIMMAPNMPKSDPVKTVYLKVAKTINSESDLGRVVRAVE